MQTHQHLFFNHIIFTLGFELVKALLLYIILFPILPLLCMPPLSGKCRIRTLERTGKKRLDKKRKRPDPSSPDLLTWNPSIGSFAAPSLLPLAPAFPPFFGSNPSTSKRDALLLPEHL
jgi:hypothetical protein